MHSLLAIAAMAVLAAGQEDYKVRVMRDMQMLKSDRLTTVQVPTLDADVLPVQYNPYPQVVVGEKLYFCGSLLDGQALMSVDLSDDESDTSLQMLWGPTTFNGVTCQGMTYVADPQSLVFLTVMEDGSGMDRGLELMTCDLDEAGVVMQCINTRRNIEGAQSVALDLSSFRVLPSGDIIAAGSMTGDSITADYPDQLICIDGATGEASLIMVNDDAGSADATWLTVVGEELVFSAQLPVVIAGTDGAPDTTVTVRGIAKLSKASDTACDYTVTTLVEPPTDPAKEVDGYIYGQIAPNGHLIMLGRASGADERYGVIAVDAAGGTVHPVYIPTAAESASTDTDSVIFGWLNEQYLIFSGLYIPVGGGSEVYGLFAAWWDEETSAWDRRLLSDPEDEGEDVFKTYADYQVAGLSGNLLWFDEDKQMMVLSGLTWPERIFALDVSALLDGSLTRGDTMAEDQRLPRAIDTTGILYDDGSNPDISGAHAGDWVFFSGNGYSEEDTGCGAAVELEQAFGYNTVTRESVQLLTEVDDFSSLTAVELPDQNAVALSFTGRKCADSTWYTGIRIYNAESLELIGTVDMNAVEAGADDSSSTSDSITSGEGRDLQTDSQTAMMRVLDDHVYFLWSAVVTTNLYSFALPADGTAEAWAAALGHTIVKQWADDVADAYYYNGVDIPYSPLAAAFGKLWFCKDSGQCLSSFDPATGAIDTPQFELVPADAEAGTEAVVQCLVWGEAITALSFGPDSTPGLFFSSWDQRDYGRSWVIYEEGDSLSLKSLSNPAYDKFSTAFFNDDAGNVYYFGTVAGVNNALMMWDGDLAAEPVVVLDNDVYKPAVVWDIWASYPVFVRDYFGEGKDAIAVWAPGDAELAGTAFGEPASNFVMINLAAPEETEPLLRPDNYYITPGTASVSYDVSRFLTAAGTTIVFGSSDMYYGVEPHVYDPAVEDAPEVAVNIYDYDDGYYTPSTLTAIPDGPWGRKQALVVARVNAEVTGVRQIVMDYPPPSPSPSPSVTPSVTPTASFSASPTPSTSVSPSVTGTPSPSPSTSAAASASAAASSEAAASATPTTTTSAAASATPTTTTSSGPAATASPTPSASKQPVARVEVSLVVPPVTKDVLASSGAAASLREFMATTANVPLDAVKITGLEYINTVTKAILLTVDIAEDDAINAPVARRMRRVQAVPSGANVAMQLRIQVLTMSAAVATAANAALSAILADPTLLTNDAAFTAFQAALCTTGGADCAAGVVLGSAIAVVSLSTPPAAAEEKSIVGPAVGGAIGALVGVLLIGGAYYYLYYKPGKVAKASAAVTPNGNGKMVVRHVQPAGEGRASFAPQSAAV